MVEQAGSGPQTHAEVRQNNPKLPQLKPAPHFRVSPECIAPTGALSVLSMEAGSVTMAITSTGAFSQDIHRHRTWFVALGTALILLGILAAGSALTATYVSMMLLAAILLVGGVLRMIAAFSARDWAGSLLLALSGVLYVVAGVLTMRHPIAAALALTLLFSALLLGVGLFRVVGSLWYRFPHWGWVALSGAISAVLGLLLWVSWPASGLWFIGFCIGIDLIVEGVGWIMLSLNRASPEPENVFSRR
jgi:uncharacterized membrane protein HdeD (DUF308 family)